MKNNTLVRQEAYQVRSQEYIMLIVRVMGSARDYRFSMGFGDVNTDKTCVKVGT